MNMSNHSNAIATGPAAPLEYRRSVNIALWVVQSLLALAFVGAAMGKLLGRPDMIALYDVIGVGQWFRYVTGIFELTGALLIVLPKTRVLGAGLLAGVMTGAIATHLFVLHNAPTAPAVLLALNAVVLWGRRHEIARLLGR
jgi:putative oxidoreductase